MVEVDEVSVDVVGKCLQYSLQVLLFFVVVRGRKPSVEAFSEDTVGVFNGASVEPGL